MTISACSIAALQWRSETRRKSAGPSTADCA
jgi:hypothetical protein